LNNISLLLTSTTSSNHLDNYVTDQSWERVCKWTLGTILALNNPSFHGHTPYSPIATLSTTTGPYQALPRWRLMNSSNNGVLFSRHGTRSDWRVGGGMIDEWVEIKVLSDQIVEMKALRYHDIDRQGKWTRRKVKEEQNKFKGGEMVA
jgi:hypothetical protein